MATVSQKPTTEETDDETITVETTDSPANESGEDMGILARIQNAGATYRNTDLGALESGLSAQHGIRDERGSSMINNGVNMVVGILVVGLLTAYLLPIAITEIAGVDTSTWGNAEAQLFDLLPIFFVIAVVLFVVDKAMKYRS